MSTSPLVISFYTEGTPYQLEVFGLLESCEKFGVDIEVVAVPSEGSWEKNCALKPKFIRDKLLEHKRAVFWVDADGVFRKEPDFSWLHGYDFSITDLGGEDRRFRYQASSIFFNYTDEGIAFANEWVEYCEKKMKGDEEIAFLDQYSFCDLLPGREGLKIAPLLPGYCKVFDSRIEIPKEEIVIELFQASRRFKHLV